MTNHYAYQVHSLYRGLVSDIVHSMNDGVWAEEQELMDKLPNIPSGIPNMSIHLAVTKEGTIIVDVDCGDQEPVQWCFGKPCINLDTSHSSIMSIARLQHTFERFWDQYISKCTRVDMQHKRGAKRATLISNRSYFAERVIRSWLERGCLDLTIQPQEIRIGNEVYHTNRAWRRNVRGIMAQSV